MGEVSCWKKAGRSPDKLKAAKPDAIREVGAGRQQLRATAPVTTSRRRLRLAGRVVQWGRIVAFSDVAVNKGRQLRLGQRSDLLRVHFPALDHDERRDAA